MIFNNKSKSFNERFKTYLFLGFVSIVIIYFITRLFNFFAGPIITIKSPLAGEKISDPTFFVEGNAKNIKTLSVNGKIINIDEKGNFKEEIVAKSPYTLIVLEAQDKYGKEKIQTLSVGKD